MHARETPRIRERKRGTMQANRRTPLRVAHNFNIAPADLAANADPERLRHRLLGGEPRGVVRGGIRHRAAVGDFLHAKRPGHEAIAKASQRLLDPRDLRDIHPVPVNHKE